MDQAVSARLIDQAPGNMTPLVLRLALLTTLVAVAHTATAAESVDHCDAAVAAAPNVYESALCYYTAAARDGSWDSTLHTLEKHHQRHTESPWYELVIGYVLAGRGSSEAAERFRSAAARFTRMGELRGELQARANLRIQLFERGDLNNAWEQVRRIREIGRQTQDVELKVRALIVTSRHYIDTGSNLTEAHQALTMAAGLLTAEHGYYLNREVLNELGQLSARFGRHGEAVDYFRRYAALARRELDHAGEALALVNQVNTEIEAAIALSNDPDMSRLVNLAEKAVVAADTAAVVGLQLTASRLLAELVALSDPDRSIALTLDCAAQARALELVWHETQCLWIRAYTVAERSPELALSIIDSAIARMRVAAAGEPTQLAFAWRYQMRISNIAKPADEAFQDGLRALSVFEALRASQTTHDARVQAFANWAADYRWLAGIRHQTRLGNEGFSDALQVMERMRARSLIDAITTNSQAMNTPADLVAQKRLAASIAALNTRLIAATDADEVDQLMRDLALLEIKETQLSPAVVQRITHVPDLQQVQAALQHDEVLLSFQLAPWSSPFERVGAGAWVLAVSKTAAAAFALPDIPQLKRSARLLRGMRFTTPADPVLIKRIVQSIVGAAIEHFSDARRLIVVPDGVLNNFPFASLFAADYEPSATDIKSLSLVPSIATWLHWRAQTSDRGLGKPLILAASSEQNNPLPAWAELTTLPPLPDVETESQAIAAVFPGAQTGSTGEAAFKAAQLADHNIIHFATHALVNHTNPDRSALLLEVDDAREDGLLQVREIARLELAGPLVVLASCQSALGREAGGEGVLGLSRAFLFAGAQVVLGSHWPIRDDHAVAFFATFYPLLATGVAADTALAQTQRSLRDAGLPMEAWAGYVLVGDGSWRLSAPTAVHSLHPGLLGLMIAIMLLPWVGYLLQARVRP